MKKLLLALAVLVLLCMWWFLSQRLAAKPTSQAIEQTTKICQEAMDSFSIVEGVKESPQPIETESLEQQCEEMLSQNRLKLTCGPVGVDCQAVPDP
jgi:ABC-type bacteriocin/lantibiotic exporter with double-glycine peptidase domain